MQFSIMNGAGRTLFFRDDAIRAEWTPDEMSLAGDFPYIDGKELERGQLIGFRDPEDDGWQLFEIRSAKTLEGGHFQQITAEALCVAELNSEHTDSHELTDVTAEYALDLVLTDTLWSIGTVQVNPTASVDIGRGDVWQAISEIKSNHNVHIEPRCTLAADGTITRVLDILPPDGEWRGLRLSVDKNVEDVSVTWDDSEVITAIKGYGYKDSDTDSTLTFSSVSWEATSDHPAKAAGSAWLIDPESTELYGRNGRPRYGFYQNANIKDASTLLQKSWESLRASREPQLQIEGTVTDLYRMGYADVPIRLHDIALIEIQPVGMMIQRQIISMTVDLLDPTQTLVTIGDFIPNIVYINHETNKSSKRGGSGKGQTKSEYTLKEFETRIEANDTMIKLEALQRIDGEEALNSKLTITAREIRGEVTNKVTGLQSTISQTATAIRTEVSNTAAGLQSTITQTATGIRADVKNVEDGLRSALTITATSIRSEVANTTAGLSSRITQNADKVSIVVDDNNNLKTASIVAGINDQSGSFIKLSADKIDLSGYVTASELNAVDARISNLTSGVTQAGYLRAATIKAGVITFGDYNLRRGYLTVDGTQFKVVMWGD